MAWAARPAGSCPALRAHIERFPQGAYRREAADLLTARRVSTVESWAPVTRQLALFESAEGPGAATEAAAQAKALARAGGDAERLCRGFESGTLFRFVSATPQAQAWSCQDGAGATVCGFAGAAQCALEVRRESEIERCGP